VGQLCWYRGSKIQAGWKKRFLPCVGVGKALRGAGGKGSTEKGALMHLTFKNKGKGREGQLGRKGGMVKRHVWARS